MVERAGVPIRRRMADFALLWETGGDVVRIVGRLKILEMATDARGRAEVVVVVRMALRTQHASVRTSERESRLRVIKLCGLPGRGVVANLALLRETGRHVIRIRRSLKILKVARYACGRREVVVAIRVALRALHLCVCTGQRKRCLRMIKRCRLPGRGCVADLALLRHTRRDVIRIRGALEILQVAGHTCRRREIEIAFGVALVTLQFRVPTCERKAHGVVVETRGLPGRGGVAILASLGKSQ